MHSSTAIEDVLFRFQRDPTVGIAYFYFDFNDSNKQIFEKFLCSLVIQLSSKQDRIHASLAELYSQSNCGQHKPATDTLLTTLRDLIKDFKHTFIIVDALDECYPREELLTSLENVANWQLQGLHVLVTSRKKQDIEQCLRYLTTRQICLQTIQVDQDIHTYIRWRLGTDPKLRRWTASIKQEIEYTLATKAHGM